MEEFFKNKNDTEGYDILSYEQQEDGSLKEIYIDVDFLMLYQKSV